MFLDATHLNCKHVLSKPVQLTKISWEFDISFLSVTSGCSGLVVEYRTRNREVAGSTHTRSTASNFEQVANLLCAQANSGSYPQRDGK